MRSMVVFDWPSNLRCDCAWPSRSAAKCLVGALPIECEPLTFQAAGPHWTAFVQGIDAAGHPIKSELANLVISFDGRDHPTPNEDYETSAWKRIDSHKYQVVRKRAGKPVLTIVNEVSTDGQTMTITTTGANAAGQPVRIVAVYDKR